MKTVVAIGTALALLPISGASSALLALTDIHDRHATWDSCDGNRKRPFCFVARHRPSRDDAYRRAETASLSQCRFAGSREMATYDENTYAGAAYFQLRCRSSAVAKANVSAAWPDGNEFLPLPSGRSRLVVYFNV